MRKTIKTAAVVAAMSALTVASATVAFAATAERTQLASIPSEATAATAAEGKWSGNDVDGWEFKVDGKKLTSTWAQIDGAWYYFNASSKMAQDELVYLDGETYYFHPDGRLQANGWVGFDYDSDVVYDYGLDIGDYDADLNNIVDDDPYDTIWMYFDENGIAKDDEWYSDPVSNLHYYFDDIIMVAGDYDHVIDGKVYGFGMDGHMYVGWEKNYYDLNKTAPNKDEDAWYYYATNGKKFIADNDLGDPYAWKEIGGEWYCFKQEGDSNGTLIVNTYFTNDVTAKGDKAWYYVDKKGVMKTGVVTIPKDAIIVDGATRTWASQTKIDKAWDVLLKSDGTANGDAWDAGRFYAKYDYTDNKLGVPVYKFENMTKGATGYASDGLTKMVYAQLIKNAFLFKDDWYLVDKNGDKVTNAAVEVGMYDVSTGAFHPGVEANYKGNPNQCRAYILVQKDGKIYDVNEVSSTDNREVRVGGKKYVATSKEYVGNNSNISRDGMQVFYYPNN